MTITYVLMLNINLLAGVNMKKRQFGKGLKWNYDLCLEEAKKYNNRHTFSKTNRSLYNAALKQGFWVEITSHMEGCTHWDLKSATKVAKKCKNRYDFKNRYRGAYAWLSRNYGLDIVFKNNVDIA